MLKRLRGGLLLLLGYLLSPLCWWNDLVFNLPIAYGFGYLCSLLSPKLLVPGAIAGYWISNIVGVVMMQFGAMDVIQNQSSRNSRKDLITGLLSSTAYTVLIVALIQFKVIDTTFLLSLIQRQPPTG
ncbi:hypothetical protein H6F43_17870 [Leptolyngbya sp. FACHB-36]|uniref:hypothetical protein n=1 Tax=Leptolyngbya sp. FACHB-36 TaxID=2692808 RepID=UPI001680CEEB|nr:hypothetical protein [Leptolyngbya sp. FACHB-36]